jgi:hypothetical protein
VHGLARPAHPADHLTSLKSVNFVDPLEALLRSRPVTMAGVLALLEHLGQDEFLGTDWGGTEADRETLLSTFNNSTRIKRRLLAQGFPLRLAAAMRDIVGSTAKG